LAAFVAFYQGGRKRGVVKAFIRKLPRRLLLASGLPELTRRLWRRDRLGVLMYHGVVGAPLPFDDWCFLAEAEFRWQVEWLARRCEIVPLVEGARRLREGSLGRSERPVVVITFDDGLACCRRFAFPILRQAGAPATVFLATGLVDSDKTLWHCRALEALGRTRRPTLEWDGRVFPLRNAKDRALASACVQAGLKHLPPAELEAALDRLERALEVPVNPSVPPESPFRVLSAGQIREMADSGLIAFGGHSHSHPILARLSEDAQRREIETSLRRVAELTGRPCESFAYPNGGPGDYDARTTSILAEAGVRVAVTSMHAPNAPGVAPLELRRYNVGSRTPREAFALTCLHFRT
jgi:peptidoglycan/xylan/chitin deacetylase (PgdA/CDA1 family)